MFNKIYQHMNFCKSNTSSLVLFVIALFVVQSCGSSGGLGSGSQSVKEYSESFSKMKEVVRNAVTGTNLNIDYVSEDDSERLVLIVNQSRYISGGGETAQREEGRVEVIKVDDNTTKVRVENPDYHFSVPTHQREDYQRKIFQRVDKILGLNHDQ